ncbi:MAG: hypothetical protein RIQ81_2317 [Pseudomonadota bacterium]|jgi:hypothetical protein
MRLSKMVCLVIAPLAILMGTAACKVGTSKLASDGTSCDAEKLRLLLEELSRIPGATGPSHAIALTADSEAQGLITFFSMGDSSIRAGLVEAINLAPAPGWDTPMGRACAAYSMKKARERCNSSRNCPTTGWFGYGDIDTTKEPYTQYRSEENANCANGIRGYVEKRSGSNPGQNNDNGLPGGPTPGQGALDPSAQGADQRRARLQAQIDACKRDIEQASRRNQGGSGAQVSEIEFRAKCEMAGGTAVNLEPPYTCQCGSGRQIDPYKEASCSTVADAKGLCSQITGASWDDRVGVCVCTANPEYRSANTWSIRNTLAKQCAEANAQASGGGGVPSTNNNGQPPQPPVKSTCQCVSQDGQCNKVVNGQVVASLTPFMNNVTGQQETCTPGGGGGYNNLCNQPQLKCP